jgi:hypothetical protein
MPTRAAAACPAPWRGAGQRWPLGVIRAERCRCPAPPLTLWAPACSASIVWRAGGSVALARERALSAAIPRARIPGRERASRAVHLGLQVGADRGGCAAVGRAACVWHRAQSVHLCCCRTLAWWFARLPALARAAARATRPGAGRAAHAHSPRIRQPASPSSQRPRRSTPSSPHRRSAQLPRAAADRPGAQAQRSHPRRQRVDPAPIARRPGRGKARPGGSPRLGSCSSSALLGLQTTHPQPPSSRSARGGARRLWSGGRDGAGRWQLAADHAGPGGGPAAVAATDSRAHGRPQRPSDLPRARSSRSCAWRTAAAARSTSR